MDKNKCKLLEGKMYKATLELKNELERIWPEGSEVSFIKSANQVTPSSGEVIAHPAPYLRVRFNTTFGKVTDVHYSDIL